VADPLAPPTRCRQALAAAFRALALPAYGAGPGRLAALAGNVVEQLALDESNLTFPAVILTPSGAAETVEPDTNAFDLIGYPTQVLICDRNGRVQHAKLAAVEYWRHRLMAAVRTHRLAGLGGLLVRTGVEPYQVVDPNVRDFQHLMSGFLVRCYCRVPASLTE
jgi:hypothetical protein